MSVGNGVFLDESQLPSDLDAPRAVEAAYAHELAEASDKLGVGLPVLFECDKELSPFLYMNLRARLRTRGLQCLYLDGRPREPAPGSPPPPGGAAAPNPMQQGIVSTMINQLRDAVRGAVERRVVVLPHLDLLTTSQGGLTGEAREVIPLLYENPELLWVGFKDPSFPIPKVIENLFPHRVSLLGIPRGRLPHLITAREARKFGRPFNPWALYKYVSGINPVRLRRLLSTVEGEDYPENPKRAYRQLRQATLAGSMEVPEVDIDKDLGGYGKVKARIKAEIIDILARKDAAGDPEAIKRIEELIPRGMIFWGPPGTGKTLFAKAIATALGAAITVVSGPELKSKWVGDSEENLRQVFRKARQSAPAIIVFDELDSFATARGTYTGSGVEHSMVNQLLTEMDGFHKEELVFVIGTTNFVESLDPALLRPGRFEFHLHIPHPEPEDREAILRIYDRKMGLAMAPETIEATVKLTGDAVPGTLGARYTGDHINALCRALARIRLREGVSRPSTAADVERAMTEWLERADMTPAEEKVVATHEIGHAICSLFCEHATPIERISIQSNTAGALGFVRYQDKAHRYVVTRGQLLDDLCILMGGREAERLLLDDVSIGAADDLRRATAIARALVEEFGLGGDAVGTRRFIREDNDGRVAQLSQSQLEAIDGEVRRLLDQAIARAAGLLREHRQLAEALRAELLARKVIDSKALTSFLDESKAPTPGPALKVAKRSKPAADPA